VSRLLDDCLAANRRWAAQAVADDPDYFKRLEAVQRPDLLWIGCADSRLPPNEIIGRVPGRGLRPPQTSPTSSSTPT
jgi:carbonic anhydrase